MRIRLKTMLLASAALAALAVPALADSYYFRTKPEVSPPQAFTFAAATDLDPATLAESATVRVKGYRNKSVAVSGTEAAFKVCSTASCSDQPTWSTVPQSGLSDDFYARVRVRAGGFGSASTARLTVGGASADFTANVRAADVDPDPVTFSATAGAVAGQPTASPIVKLTGHDGISVSAANASYRICTTADCSQNSGWKTSATTAAKDTWAQLQATAPAAGTTINPLPALVYGARTASWSLASAAGGMEFGITDTALASAVSAGLPANSNWVKCTFGASVGTESCVGALGTLVVFKATASGYEFGGYYPGDLASNSGCWVYPNGFYFTNVPARSGYLMYGNGSPGTGRIMVCEKINFVGLQYLDTTNPSAYSSNGEWNTGYTLNGGANGARVPGTMAWYKRKS